jgi:hypothetical protein
MLNKEGGNMTIAAAILEMVSLYDPAPAAGAAA